MFSMCSELTPRARIPDTRIPQLMQPCPSVAAVEGIPARVEHKLDIIMPEGCSFVWKIAKQFDFWLVVDMARYKTQGSSEDLSFTDPL